MKHKLQLSKREWVGIGLRTGWITKEAHGQYHNPKAGSGVKSIELYRGQSGDVTIDEGFGVPFMAEIYYNYIPAEEPSYTDGQMTYPGDPKTIEILEVKDSTNGNSIDIDMDSLKMKYRNDLIEDYESKSDSQFEDSLESRSELPIV